MKHTENDFVYGRARMIKMLIITAVCMVLSLVFPRGSMIGVATLWLTIISFAATVWVVYRYCRCPNCGKIIFFGVAVIKVCPRCHRSLTSGKKVKKSSR